MGRFASLVDTPEGIEAFKTQYNISPGVNIWHCLLGEWHAFRPEGAVVIPMIAFIEGGMQIPMGRVTRDFLIAHRLCPTQCSPNLFRILGNVDALNQKMGWTLPTTMLTGYIIANTLRTPGITSILGFPWSNLFRVSPNPTRAWTKTS